MYNFEKNNKKITGRFRVVKHRVPYGGFYIFLKREEGSVRVAQVAASHDNNNVVNQWSRKRGCSTNGLFSN